MCFGLPFTYLLVRFGEFQRCSAHVTLSGAPGVLLTTFFLFFFLPVRSSAVFGGGLAQNDAHGLRARTPRGPLFLFLFFGLALFSRENSQTALASRDVVCSWRKRLLLITLSPQNAEQVRCTQ
jgi:hypothetical protein